MKPFTKQELKAVIIILLAISTVTGFNLRIALRRARDAQRRADLGTISNALDTFFNDFGFFPPAENGKIKTCKGIAFDETMQQIHELAEFDRNLFFQALRTCEWGKDSLTDLGVFGEESKNYLENVPDDPKKDKGFDYLYFSNTKRFQIYAYLEGGQSEVGYDVSIVDRNLSCGSKICSFGKAYGETPLDRSIEEYEQELLEKMKSSQN